MNLPAVIVLAESQRARVERLVEFCRQLDGTNLFVIRNVPGTDLGYPLCNNAAFAFVANAFKGVAFFWMEPDAIPLHPKWKQTLANEYIRGGKEFMLSSDQKPHDLVGGIGIYGPNTHALIPKEFVFGSWDGWIIENLVSMLHRTPLIQHSYGEYEVPGQAPEVARPHRFPAELGLIRPEAQIFHRDSCQDLIPLIPV